MTWKDVIQTSMWIVAIIGGILAAGLSIHERRMELRWRRSNKAKELVDDIHRHSSAGQAVHMLDWHDHNKAYEYTLKEDVHEPISYNDVMSALKLARYDCNRAADIFIHDCFDWFFYFVNQIELAINRKLIDWRDVEPVFKPYVKTLSHDWLVFAKFLNMHQYDGVEQFFKRYSEFHPSHDSDFKRIQ